jgi:hypothetical protein
LPSAHAVVIVDIEVRGMNNIRWNGKSIDKATMVSRLSIISDDFPLPFIAVKNKSKDCITTSEMLEVIYKSYPCRDGACGYTVT